MHRTLKFFIVLAAFSASLAAQSPLRDLSGSVRDRQNHPLRGAVVQLENEDTEAVQTFLTDADGHYNFKRVRSDTDYRLSASYQGRRSKSKEISKFSSKMTPYITLRVSLR